MISIHKLFAFMQGHFQIMFNPKVCPLFQSQLSWGMRILYSSGVWAYMCAAISTPTFIIIPLVGPIPHPATDAMCTASPLTDAVLVITCTAPAR